MRTGVLNIAMGRRGKILAAAIGLGLLGVIGLCAATGWLLWRQSVESETDYSGGLAAQLGQRTGRIILGIRDMLSGFDSLSEKPCSPDHLEALKRASVSRPYVRGIGYWHADDRLCGIGFLPDAGIRPRRADRIYPNGVIAWWPSPQTQIGGIQMFLMRYGDYDVAIDPNLLLDAGLSRQREAALWVEGLRLATIPADAQLPAPDKLSLGVTLDRTHDLVLSHFAENAILPIDVVAQEPMIDFWTRHAPILLLGGVLGLLLIVGWIDVILRLSHRELNPATELHRAIQHGRISVQYQPVVDLQTSRCVGAEALARWQHEDGEWISPAVFIPLAEKAGLIRDITQAVMKIAIRDLRRIFDEVGSVSINLNLSRDDLLDDRVGRELATRLRGAELPTSAIKLEITERSLVNSDTARILIHDLRDNGHDIAIDDFGTGYSSLSYLQSFELDLLKIDKTFVDAIETGAATSQVIVHVIEMAKSLRLRLVAEGVETQAQVAWLARHGVDYGQGYLFSRPLTLEDFIAYHKANGHEPRA